MPASPATRRATASRASTGRSATDADAVIVELGANDALRGVDPAITRDALDRILAAPRRAQAAGAARRHAGAAQSRAATTAPRSIPSSPDLAARHGAILYPFFLDGVAADPALNQADGMHPNAAGVDVIVGRILPAVEALVAKAAARI